MTAWTVAAELQHRAEQRASRRRRAAEWARVAALVLGLAVLPLIGGLLIGRNLPAVCDAVQSGLVAAGVMGA